jgi:hypothetical protein
MTQVDTIQEIYRAFACGDVPAILGRLVDEVDWEHNSLDHGIPWLKPGAASRTCSRSLALSAGS